MRRFEAEVRRRHGGYPLMVMRVVAAVPTFAHVPAADGDAVMEATAALAADRHAIVESTATLAADRNAVVEPAASFTSDGNAVAKSTTDLETTTAAL